MVDVPVAIAMGKAAVDAAKALRGLARKAKNIEMEGAVLDLQSQVNDLNSVINDLTAENAKLRQQNDLVQELKYDSATDLYWRQDGENREGPFCPKCMDTETRAAHMEDRPGYEFYRCHSCDHTVRKPGYRPRGGWWSAVRYDGLGTTEHGLTP